jgi:iron complex outermembrane receptor protein
VPWSLLNKCLIIFALLLFAEIPVAQDTTKLIEIEVTAIRQSTSFQKTIKIDSIDLANQSNRNLGELLANHTTIFIKNYGNGALGTTSFRGGSANQTAVLWEGINLKNTMLGQADLSLLPVVLFSQVQIDYGGGSALWGSDAMGGSIHLSGSNKQLKQGLSLITQLGSSSLNAMNAFTGFSYAAKKLSTETKIYLNQNKNQFKYIDTNLSKEPITIKHAAYNNFGFMQNVNYAIHPNHQIKLSLWFNSFDRQLPNFSQTFKSKQYQYDRNTKLIAQHHYAKNRMAANTKAAYFVDVLNYIDSTAGIYSYSRVENLVIDHENKFQINKRSRFQSGFNLSGSKAITKNYEDSERLLRMGLYMMYSYNWLDNLTTSAVIRYEVTNLTKIPVTGNLNLSYQLTKRCFLKLNAANVFRQPSLNELFWLPGGNRNLLPENGNVFDGEIRYQKNHSNLAFDISLAAYHKIINNWILWLPGPNGNPSPKNIQQVFSRGTETSTKLTYQLKSLKVGMQFLTHYCLSTITKQDQDYTNSLNKQLIYTPRYTGNFNLFVQFKSASLQMNNQYVGYRFTSSDNSGWLNPYYVSSIRLNYQFILGKESNVNLFAASQNLFNSNYHIVENRPMPLRYFEFGLSINYYKPKTNIKS